MYDLGGPGVLVLVGRSCPDFSGGDVKSIASLPRSSGLARQTDAGGGLRGMEGFGGVDERILSAVFGRGR
jgi:hypothetical protein